MPPLFTNKPYWLQLCYLLLFILGSITIFASLTTLMGQLDIKAAIGSRWYFYVVQSIGLFGMFFIPALLFSYCASKKWFFYSEVEKIASPKLVGWVLILSLFILPIVACLGYFNEQITLPESLHHVEAWMKKMEETNRLVLRALTANSAIPVLLINLVIMAVFPALFEEFFFRGTLQQFFTKWFANHHIAIVITAFIFSAIHLQFYGFIPRFLLGIYLGYLLIWGKSLWLPIIAHFMHNAVTLIFDYGAQRQGIDLEALEPTQIQEFYPVVLLCTIAVAAGIYYLWRKSKVLML